MQNIHIKTALFGTGILAIAIAAFTYQPAKPVTVISDTPNGYRWTRLTENAAFRKSYNFQLFSHRGLLWAFHPAGNYFSANGKEWTKSVLPNCINNLAFLDYLQFNQDIIGLGYFSGNIEKFDLRGTITRSNDMKRWDTLTRYSNLPRRFFYHPVMFNNKIWIYGGSDGTREFDDCWSSTDAVHWKQEAVSLPFGASSGDQYLVFRNKLFRFNNDVWVSSDGLNWKRISPAIANVTLTGYSAVVFDEKIWLLGCNRNQQFRSEVMVSSDGIRWEKQDAPWTPRGGIAATSHNGKLYITGGKYGGFKKGTTETEFVYSNDVWCLEKIK